MFLQNQLAKYKKTWTELFTTIIGYQMLEKSLWRNKNPLWRNIYLSFMSGQDKAIIIYSRQNFTLSKAELNHARHSVLNSPWKTLEKREIG